MIGDLRIESCHRHKRVRSQKHIDSKVSRILVQHEIRFGPGSSHSAHGVEVVEKAYTIKLTSKKSFTALKMKEQGTTMLLKTKDDFETLQRVFGCGRPGGVSLMRVLISLADAWT